MLRKSNFGGTGKQNTWGTRDCQGEECGARVHSQLKQNRLTFDD